MMRDLEVRTLGSTARDVLVSGSALRVFARFERSLYIRDETGGLACVGGEALGRGPLNVILPIESFDTTAYAEGDVLEFDLADATLWQPAACPEPDLKVALAALEAACQQVTPRGLAAERRGDLVNTRGRSGLAALSAWVAAPSTAIPDPIVALAGLGPGLTPAGDDALGGALITLRAFGRPAVADQLAARLLPAARTRTSVISFAHLKAAAGGEGVAPMHDTLAAIARADHTAVAAGLRRLDRIGHSSGWDALAGTIAALTGLARTG